MTLREIRALADKHIPGAKIRRKLALLAGALISKETEYDNSWGIDHGTDEDDKVSVFNKSCELGSLTMTGYLWE